MFFRETFVSWGEDIGAAAATAVMADVRFEALWAELWRQGTRSLEGAGSSGLCEPTCLGDAGRDTDGVAWGLPAGRTRGASEIARVGANGRFRLRLATGEKDRLCCWNLVHREYVALGYAQGGGIEYRYTLNDALPGTGTFLVEADGHPAGTVTVFPDSPLGLPADELYHEELDRLREEGRRPVEVGRLTIDKAHTNEREILTTLFDVLSLYSRCLRDATDLVITVNPSHVKFYERMLLFEPIGEQREFQSVCGAPAVLLRLDLETQREVIRWTHGEGPRPAGLRSERTFYKYFSTEREERERVSRLRKTHRPPDGAFVQRYFAWLRPHIPAASVRVREFLQECYPEVDMGALVPAGSDADLVAV